jgi:hypothetical protein
MSIIYDKGKIKQIYESENKSKKSSSIPRKIIKNQIIIKQPQQLITNYGDLSPNISMNKKSLLKTIYNSSSLNQGSIIKSLNRKSNNQKNMIYNRSFEGGFYKNRLNYNSSESNQNLDYKIKNKSNSKIKRTQNFTSEYKSKTNNKANNSIKKYEENFKSLESNIVDKKFQNDIDHDEMIIATNKNTVDISNANESKNLFNIINNKTNSTSNSNINNNFISITEENLLNCSFENNKYDFKLLYVDHYTESVPDDMLILEIKLLLEKILELQKSYHKELDIILNKYFIYKFDYKNNMSKYDIIRKKIVLFQKFMKKKNRRETHNYLGVYHKKNFQDVNDINKKEFIIWKMMINVNGENENEIKERKEKLKEIFKISVFKKFNKMKNLSDVEIKIIQNLMKKYKYTMKNESDENKMKNNKSNNSLRKYNNKKILSPITNKNVSFLTNTKLKHQKMQSYFNKEKNLKSTSIKFIKSK